jgi:hypothetical protein
VIPVAGRSSEASAQPLAGADQQPAPKESFLTLLWEAGFDLRIDPSATVARALEWLVVVGVSVGSLLLWLLAVKSMDLDLMTDVGLVSVLPAWSYLAFIPIASAFAIVLSGPRSPTWLLATIVIVLVVMLYGAVPLIEGEPRFSPSYRHIGLIDYVTRHGSVDATIDAYQNWPGMFILASAAANAVGLTDMTGVATWAPLWFNLLYLPALFVLLDSLTDDRRAVWLGIWLFYLADWIGQDYFAPQALGFFLFLTATAVLVRWLSARDAAGQGGSIVAGPPLIGRFPRPVRILLDRVLEREPMRAEKLSPVHRAGLMAAFLVIFGFTIAGHQLTPFFVAGAAGVLVLLVRVRWPSLPILMGVMIAAWVAFVAVAFLIGHFQNVAGYVGTLSDTLVANLTSRLDGSSGHRDVVVVRLGFAVAVWILAGFGIIRRLLAGRWDVTAVALAAAPFPLFAVQQYGGEMLLRIYLFSLPFMALLMAFALLPRRRDELSKLVGVIVVVTSVALVAPFMVARYGNERIESFRPGEVAAVEQLYRIAPKGSMLVSVDGDVPWKTIRYEEYRYRPSGGSYYQDLDGMFAEMSQYNGPVYLIVTRAQGAYAEMILGASPDEWTAFEGQLFATGWFQVVSRTPDATIARFIPPEPTS